mmetsp:Transcript_28042/g.75750  ORF Transcript_28042/g.75750 Transcript_28042/m.75750 type:complete len:211 (-) Transcript_28042:170-802(-)
MVLAALACSLVAVPVAASRCITPCCCCICLSMEEMRLIQEEVAVLLEGSWAAFLGALRVAITACTALLAAPRVSGVSPSSRLDSRASVVAKLVGPSMLPSSKLRNVLMSSASSGMSIPPAARTLPSMLSSNALLSSRAVLKSMSAPLAPLYLALDFSPALAIQSLQRTLLLSRLLHSRAARSHDSRAASREDSLAAGAFRGAPADEPRAG